MRMKIELKEQKRPNSKWHHQRSAHRQYSLQFRSFAATRRQCQNQRSITQRFQVFIPQSPVGKSTFCEIGRLCSCGHLANTIRSFCGSVLHKCLTCNAPQIMSHVYDSSGWLGNTGTMILCPAIRHSTYVVLLQKFSSYINAFTQPKVFRFGDSIFIWVSRVSQGHY